MKTLARNGSDGSPMDDLTYVYQNSDNSNRLARVSDAGSASAGFVDGSNLTQEYQYDDSGNLEEDRNKDITSISYNHLNLPRVVAFDNGNEIRYTYDATGTKLKQEVKPGVR